MTEHQHALRTSGFTHWNTPDDFLDTLRAFLPIDLDPCSNPYSRVAADCNVALPLDGLAWAWHAFGHTFVNPPYDELPAWLHKAACERTIHGADTITMLIPNSMETAAFREYVFGHADAVAVWRRRVGFVRSDGGKVSGNSHASALVYYGDEVERFIDHFKGEATVLTRWET